MPKDIQKILIANRGEIALRIHRAIKDLGLQSVAVYSDADSESRHRFAADFAVRLPGEASADTYLNIERLIDAAKVTGCDAVHPGYGFLSESSVFAAAVEKAGLVFIGPTVESMELMGHKVRARELMKKHNVPIVPGSSSPLANLEELKSLIKEIGYPVILKAAAGGGGRGMRVVRDDSTLEESFVACQREAVAYFGNGDVFCERYIENPRHIEFQILFDSHGHGVHLHERDCSVQRRHQKLIEEAPSMFLTEEIRQKVGDIAVTAGKAAGYRGAGTVEFICESIDKIYFMEMNTRIQVEHPVTEMITATDLIAWQIKVARGDHLTLQQNDLPIKGWAFEARINAEDPTKGFQPGPGRITALQLPHGPGVRVDTHVYEGYQIPASYDSMIAKIIAWGDTRDEALAKLDRALAETIIEGIPTTIGFHRQLIRNEVFRSGDFNTSFLEKHGDAITSPSETPELEESQIAAILTKASKRLPGDRPATSVWATQSRRESIL